MWLEHASRCGRITDGVFQVPLSKTELGNFFLYFDFLRSDPLHATSARCVRARNYIGHKTQKRDATIAVIGKQAIGSMYAALTSSSGFSHVSIFNQEILNPSKSLPSDFGVFTEQLQSLKAIPRNHEEMH